MSVPAHGRRIFLFRYALGIDGPSGLAADEPSDRGLPQRMPRFAVAWQPPCGCALLWPQWKPARSRPGVGRPAPRVVAAWPCLWRSLALLVALLAARPTWLGSGPRRSSLTNIFCVVRVAGIARAGAWAARPSRFRR